ncbi:hypothetical protein CLOM_g9224 [Closterium sp. NIES-68]|nr:hypothetical protein CLOM_g9224 [Closterium sp. NIES-68]GJP61410.1 hypothetical protein CLOP_g18578 [Closterium sp. NIES-67]
MFCTCCCSQCCESLGSCCCAVCSLGTSRRVAKYVYGLLFLFALVLMWCLRDFGQAALMHLPSFKECKPGDQACTATTVVLCTGLGMSLFFALMSVTTLGARVDGGGRDTWHSGWWPPKLLLWAGLLGVTACLPLGVLSIYGYVAVAGAAIFVVIQLVSMLNFVFVWNDTWQADKKWHVWGAVVTGTCYVALAAAAVLMFIFFAPSSSCSLNISFICSLLILVLILTLVCLLPAVESAGLLSTGVMAVYFAFLCWSAIMSEPPGETCNTRPRQTGQTTWTDVTAFIFALLTIVVSVYTVGIDRRCISLHPGSGEDVEGAGNGKVSYGHGFFHFVFLTGTMYMTMLFIGWDLRENPAQWSLDTGWASTWVKMGIMWFSGAVYLWVLVAPLVIKGRDFS